MGWDSLPGLGKKQVSPPWERHNTLTFSACHYFINTQVVASMFLLSWVYYLLLLQYLISDKILLKSARPLIKPL